MILLLSTLAMAASCCSSGGTQPISLDSCDRLGMALSFSGDGQFGGWGLTGSWYGMGDDGDANAQGALLVAARANDWFQAGIRLPVALEWRRIDEEGRVRAGNGEFLLWGEVETQGTWKFAADLGVGLEEFRSMTPWGPTTALGLKLAERQRPWGLWLAVSGKWRWEAGIPVIEGEVAADHSVGGFRPGLSVAGNWTGGTYASWFLEAGPLLSWVPDHQNRWLLSLKTTVAGREAPAKVVLSLGWFRVLKSM